MYMDELLSLLWDKKKLEEEIENNEKGIHEGRKEIQKMNQFIQKCDKNKKIYLSLGVSCGVLLTVSAVFLYLSFSSILLMIAVVFDTIIYNRWKNYKLIAEKKKEGIEEHIKHLDAENVVLNEYYASLETEIEVLDRRKDPGADDLEIEVEIVSDEPINADAMDSKTVTDNAEKIEELKELREVLSSMEEDIKPSEKTNRI